MKLFLIITVAILGMILGGWLTFSSSEDEMTIKVDKAEVVDDTRDAVDAGERLVERISEKTSDAVDKVTDSDPPVESDTVPPAETDPESVNTLP